MNKLILLGVDVDLSPATQQALYVTSELFAHSSADLCLVLLHVIPIPYDTTPAWGKIARGSAPFPSYHPGTPAGRACLAASAESPAATGDCAGTYLATPASRSACG